MNDFTDAVDRALKGLKFVSVGVCAGCEECADCFATEIEDSGDFDPNRGFSWSDCGVCGSTLGGDRYFWHAWDAETNETMHFDDMCSDCVRYLADGDEPEDWRRYP